MAYLINTVSKELGAATFIIKSTESWMSPAVLPLLTFAIAAFISFATGTSWGTYAIIIPIAVPLAFAFSGGEVNTLIYAAGAVFGEQITSSLSVQIIVEHVHCECFPIQRVGNKKMERDKRSITFKTKH